MEKKLENKWKICLGMFSFRTQDLGRRVWGLGALGEYIRYIYIYMHGYTVIQRSGSRGRDFLV